MYRPVPRLRDRAGTLALVVLLHIAVIAALLRWSGVDVDAAGEKALEIFDIRVESPPPPPPPPERIEEEKPREEEGASAPPNIKSEATPVVAPPPRIIVPAPTPVVAAPTPGAGADPSQGAAPVAGPGTGAGGTGTGTGSGGSGDGSGGGGTGLGEARARLASPPLTRRDYPDSIYRRWPPRGAVFVIIQVGPDGRALSCRVARSIGDPAIDDETCRLAMTRLRFEPGRDERGRPVVDFVGYRQMDIGRFERR